MDALRCAAEADEPVRLAEADLDFHRQLLRLAGSEILLRAWEDVAVQIRRHKTLTDRNTVSDPRTILETHYPILAVLRTGSGERAEHMLSRHVLSAKTGSVGFPGILLHEVAKAIEVTAKSGDPEQGLQRLHQQLPKDKSTVIELLKLFVGEPEGLAHFSVDSRAAADLLAALQGEAHPMA